MLKNAKEQSCHRSHIKAINEVRGIEAIKPAKSEDLFAISATVTTTIAVITSFDLRSKKNSKGSF